MINIDFTNIDNAAMIGRLLPFWTRGRRFSLLLEALLYPLKYPHMAFQKWALERYIEHHITGQKMSLEWYLKYKLKAHFRESKRDFFITQSVAEVYKYLSNGLWDNGSKWNNYVKWENGLEGIPPDMTEDWDGTTIVLAPAIVETVSYDYADYERDIRYIMSKYMINFSKIHIVFSAT